MPVRFPFYLILCLFLVSVSARGDQLIYKKGKIQLNAGGYARFYTGKLENYKYNSVFKTELRLSGAYRLTDDLSLKGKYAYRIVRDDKLESKNLSKTYDAYVTLQSNQYGTADIGKRRNIAYLLHQGSVDVSCLDVDDSDISYFYKRPKGFYAPTLTYLNTDSRDPKITYTLPSVNGFISGITVVQRETTEPDIVLPLGTQINHGRGSVLGAQYKYDFNNKVWAAVSGGLAFYRHNHFIKAGENVTANHREYSLGLKINLNHLTFGTSYKRLLFPDKAALQDSSAFGTGVAFNKGAYGISISWLHSQATFIEKNKYNHVMLSNKYTFTPYLEGYLSGGTIEFYRKHFGSQKHLFGILGLELKI